MQHANSRLETCQIRSFASPVCQIHCFWYPWYLGQSNMINLDHDGSWNYSEIFEKSQKNHEISQFFDIFINVQEFWHGHCWFASIDRYLACIDRYWALFDRYLAIFTGIGPYWPVFGHIDRYLALYLYLYPGTPPRTHYPGTHPITRAPTTPAPTMLYRCTAAGHPSTRPRGVRQASSGLIGTGQVADLITRDLQNPDWQNPNWQNWHLRHCVLLRGAPHS